VDESLQHLHLQPDKPGSVVQFVAYEPTRIFCVKVSSQKTGNEVVISYRKSDTRKTRLIRDKTDQVQVQVQVDGITNKK
jgi:hypothetical protein